MISRRVFIRNALIVSAGTWAVALGVAGLARPVRSWLFPRYLPGSVLEWLAEMPGLTEAADAVELSSSRRKVLVEDLEAFLTTATADTGSFQTALQARINDDFAADRLIIVDGWQLTETEVGLFLIGSDVARGIYRAV